VTVTSFGPGRVDGHSPCYAGRASVRLRNGLRLWNVVASGNPLCIPPFIFFHHDNSLLATPRLRPVSLVYARSIDKPTVCRCSQGSLLLLPYISDNRARRMLPEVNTRHRSKLPSYGADAEMAESQSCVIVPPSEMPNPNPLWYTKRQLSGEQRNREAYSGIHESIWAPSDEPLTGPRTWRVPQDLQGYIATQLEFTFPHCSEDRKDDWFSHVSDDLFCRVNDFSVKHFGLAGRDIVKIGDEKLWQMGFSTKFSQIASQVARGDKLVGGWEHLLVNGRERPLLVNGVVAKILIDYVLDNVLFGAGKDEDILLRTLDLTHFREEGKMTIHTTHAAAELITQGTSASTRDQMRFAES
jgi:hypothetical protein